MRTVLRTASLLAAGLTLSIHAAPIQAQTPIPDVMISHMGTGEILRDVAYLLGLTTSEEQKQLPVLQDYLNDIYFVGIRRDQPARLDVYLDGGTARYRLHVPIQNFDQFRRQNVEPLGIDVRQIAARGLFKLRDDQTKDLLGYMRFKDGFATLSEEPDEVPANLPPPLDPVMPLLKGFEGIIDAHNPAARSEDQAARTSAFERDRPNLISELQPQQGETEDDFRLRQILYDHQLDEFARIYAEAADLFIGAVIDSQGQRGWADLRMIPIPGSPLEAVVNSACQRPSDFANVPRVDKPVLSGKLNHPLDPIRQENLFELTTHLRMMSEKHFDGSETLSENERSKSKESVNAFFDLVDEIVKSQLLDIFAEAYRNEKDKVTMYGAVRSPNGNAALEVLKLMSEANTKRKVEMDVDRVGDVAIHKVTLAPDEFPEIQDFFGREPYYVGTTEQHIWMAAGAGALTELKAAIGEVAKPNTGNPEDPFLDVVMQMGPWVKLFDQLRGNKGDVKMRALAVAALSSGQDVTTLKLTRKGNAIEGNWFLNPGLLRFGGKVLSDFSRENLDD